MPPNQFAPSMTKLWIPPHMSQMVAVGGFEVAADADGWIEVPNNLAASLEEHGLLREKPAAAADAKKK